MLGVIMDDLGDLPDIDPDTIVRLKVCGYVNDMAERGSCYGLLTFPDPASFIAAAELLEHYITKGGTVAFDCADVSRKFVRGE